jgi:hypothetical protein
MVLTYISVYGEVQLTLCIWQSNIVGLPYMNQPGKVKKMVYFLRLSLMFCGRYCTFLRLIFAVTAFVHYGSDRRRWVIGLDEWRSERVKSGLPVVSKYLKHGQVNEAKVWSILTSYRTKGSLQYVTIHRIKSCNLNCNCLGNFFKIKDCGLTLLSRLTQTRHSLARTHYWPTRELLAAGCPPWPITSLLRSNLIP